MIKVLPSSNPEREDNLINYAKSLSELGVEYLHCDVMDGKFVENKCLPLNVLENVRNNTNIGLDVHLMIENPIKEIKKYLKLKPNIITVHYEAFKNPKQIKKMSKLVRKKDIMFGISIKPKTPTGVLLGLEDIIDLILIMSVEPGKSGQKFMDSAIQKIVDAKTLFAKRDVIIEVDGGINEDNFKSVVQAGAEFLVMGNAFYSSTDRAGLLRRIDKHYSN